MSLIDWVLLALYVIAAGLVASGVVWIYPPAGLIVAGAELAGIAYLASDDGK